MTRRLSRPAARGGHVVVAGVRISHSDRIVYADPPTTKADVARYYDRIADWIVPHVQGRPLTLVRCPEGMSSGCFFMKHSKVWAPEPLRRVRIQEKTKVGEYLIADTTAAVVGLVQMGVLEIHTWNSVIDDIERPNRIVIDLDPGERVTWRRVVEAASLVRRALEALELDSFPKTTGGRGLHVVIPLTPSANWSDCLEFSPPERDDRADRTGSVHHTILESRPGEQDPPRLPAEQPDEHLDRRLLDTRARSRAGQRADRMGRAVAVVDARADDAAFGAGEARAAASRSMEGVLEHPAEAHSSAASCCRWLTSAQARPMQRSR